MSMTPLNMHRFADRWGRENRSIAWDKITMSQRCLETAEGTLTGRLLKGFLVSLTTMLFVFALPFLLGLLLIPSLPPDDRWFLKMALTFLGPFSAVLWFIAFSHLARHRKAGCFMQVVVFFGTAAVIYLLLINGMYRL
jgi:hypothetical protein